jgi:hypothetical protein
MAQQLDRHTLLEGTKRKRRSKPTLSSQELAKRYFDLQCLRQKVRIAESGQIVGRENDGIAGEGLVHVNEGLLQIPVGKEAGPFFVAPQAGATRAARSQARALT